MPAEGILQPCHILRPEDVFMPRAVIFANGQLPDIEAARSLLQADDYLIAADGGANHLMRMGILPGIVIGDLDSVDEDTLFELTSAGVTIEKHSEDKNETDFELALRYAVELQPSAILIIGALGGRLDQTLANLSMLTDLALPRIDIRLDDGVEEVFFCRATAANRGQAEVRGRSGDTVSLIPWQAPVKGVTTEGLQWPLSGDTLYPDKSRGISNLMLADSASVSIQSGLLLIVHRRYLVSIQ
jgi:thiamine pyrophosphokinase